MSMMIAAALALASPAPQCVMNPVDRLWAERALDNFGKVSGEKLQLADRALPTVVMFDAACSYVAPPGRTALRFSAKRHGGTVTLPDGGEVPVGTISFAAPETTTSPGYFVMALPSVWRAQGVKSKLGLERLMDGVLLHEMMHTYQFYFVTPRLAELTETYGLPDDLSDDSLQEAFKDNANYVAAYEEERDLLFAAARAPDDGQARHLAGEALAKMRARRARFFTGDQAKWAPLDEIFLTMEGIGQWVSYAWLADPEGGAVPEDLLLPEVRRGGRFWTQDEGLAAFLVIDRLVPGWQRHAFAETPETVEALLARAAKSPSAN
ncbi:hypothetical protein [Allosphingosinicella indica]|uniref:Uncharacterized protein n=1 Tax=Allosphingosinicella indica TaxID=941907 RepID=A0A1X7FZF8_9SPHN|nr:hypothetical protein [Allosphingosinicella indica]SMF61482.1 hypothetical protein SAMN06295910_0471 [Allosphingosinicella indica]